MLAMEYYTFLMKKKNDPLLMVFVSLKDAQQWQSTDPGIWVSRNASGFNGFLFGRTNNGNGGTACAAGYSWTSVASGDVAAKGFPACAVP